jgi:hypothetical protein
MIEMWENRRANRFVEAKAEIDLPRRGLQWETHKDGSVSWQEVPSIY